MLQMALRAVVIFISALLMLRLAHKRFFASRNAIDVLLSFVLASTLARAINGSAAFFPTIGVGFLLILLHAGVSRLAHRFKIVDGWVKGHSQVVVRDGQVDEAMLSKHSLTKNDLEEDMRSNGSLDEVSEVGLATLERSGEISVLKKPKVVTISVEKGVQTVQVQLGG